MILRLLLYPTPLKGKRQKQKNKQTETLGKITGPIRTTKTLLREVLQTGVSGGREELRKVPYDEWSDSSLTNRKASPKPRQVPK